MAQVPEQSKTQNPRPGVDYPLMIYRNAFARTPLKPFTVEEGYVAVPTRFGRPIYSRENEDATRPLDAGEGSIERGVGGNNMPKPTIPEQYNRLTVLPAGWYIKKPFTKYHRVSLMETQFDIPPQGTLTKEKMVVKVDGLLSVRIINEPRYIAQALFRVDDLEEAIYRRGTSMFKELVEGEKLEKLIELDEQKTTDEMRNKYPNIAEEWGIEIVRASLKQTEYPKILSDAIANLEAAKKDAESLKVRGEPLKDPYVLAERALEAIQKAQGTVIIPPSVMELLQGITRNR